MLEAACSSGPGCVRSEASGWVRFEIKPAVGCCFVGYVAGDAVWALCEVGRRDGSDGIALEEAVCRVSLVLARQT